MGIFEPAVLLKRYHPAARFLSHLYAELPVIYVTLRSVSWLTKYELHSEPLEKEGNLNLINRPVTVNSLIIESKQSTLMTSLLRSRLAGCHATLPRKASFFFLMTPSSNPSRC